MEHLEGKSFYAEYTLASSSGKLTNRYTDTLTFTEVRDKKLWGTDDWQSVKGKGHATFSGQVTGKDTFVLVESQGVSFQCKIKGRKIKALFTDVNSGDIGYIYYRQK
jgi:hypothetical protein